MVLAGFTKALQTDFTGEDWKQDEKQQKGKKKKVAFFNRRE